ncbi:2-oxoacid dehydrogenases acyltransferase (catalytic domain) [Oxobacter pfennigii]|uniref:2-oxoacid dehydrogenases acyltransferase (Catalytic domain) n=1 Tax=Oxobacter pfennigii TaxID=36849 RepID=A0A0P8WMN5_9CLOT|nr:hypothetical protein [Oxobacter pfennigii]KPU43765.1 2-oxoacid dehydrogenases acyltransferase (catalytic domain) [Oxobacter pfennigii]
MGKYKRRFGDRYDGRLLRSLDPFYKIMPYIMKTRVDSQVYFHDKFDVTETESYLKQKRSQGVKNIGYLHVIIAAMVRLISQKPGVNRFVAGQKIYARNEILISLAVKRKMSVDSPETTIKFKFEPDDTLFDVVEKMNDAIEKNKKEDSKNDTDKTARIFMLCPGFIVKFLVWFLQTLDYFGLMPKIINEVSPFHTSAFVTDLGSLGIQPIYHHIYEFGTTSTFIAFGIKGKERVTDRESNTTEKKYINFKAVGDERIVDGYYYANAFKLFKKLVENPIILEMPPVEVFEDVE